MNLQENVINVVSWATKINSSRICTTTDLKEDLSLDEIDKMSIILEFEKWFGLELSKDEAENVETIKDLIDLATNCRKRQAA